MADSLQDQLLKLGLAKTRPAKDKRARKKSQKGRNAADQKAAGAAPEASANDELSLARAYAERQRLEKQEIEATARRKKAENERRRKLNDKLKSVIEPAVLNDPAGEEERYFEFAGKIRKVYVTPPQLKQLNSGQLGIVSFRGRYLLLASDVIEKVNEIKSEAIAFLAVESGEQE